jgi:hypothetical protein
MGPVTANDDITLGAVLLAEYEHLKREQQSRIRTRDNLLYVTLTAAAAAVAVTLNASGGPRLLLLVPPIVVILGWTYLVNDQKISAVGQYVRDTISPRLSAAVGESVLNWEWFHRSDTRRVSRKRQQLAADLITFTVLPTAALVVFWLQGNPTIPLIVISVVETAAVAVLAAQLVLNADLSRT